jgi:hypothetical protein
MRGWLREERVQTTIGAIGSTDFSVEKRRRFSVAGQRAP